MIQLNDPQVSQFWQNLIVAGKSVTEADFLAEALVERLTPPSVPLTFRFNRLNGCPDLYLETVKLLGQHTTISLKERVSLVKGEISRTIEGPAAQEVQKGLKSLFRCIDISDFVDIKEQTHESAA